MAVTTIPNVTNWSVTPQNGQAGYFTLMNTWLSESTIVIESLKAAIDAQNTANNEINDLAIQTENNATIATSLANYQGAWSHLVTYDKGQSVESAIGSKIYYISKVDNNLNHAVTDTNYWLPNPINEKLDKDFSILENKSTPIGTDIFVIREIGGLLKKISWATLLTPTIATGTATFTATTNNINLTGIGVGVEIGDVIQISGATDTKNNSEFTIDVILDANNIVVNQAHANKGTSKNIVTRASDTDVTIKLLSKHYNAEATLGRDWVDVSTIRANNVFYPNNSNRVRKIKISSSGTVNSVKIYSGTQVIDEGNNNSTGARYTSTGEIPNGNDFKVEYAGTVFLWKELL